MSPRTAWSLHSANSKRKCLFAANVLGTRETLLSVLAHFFEDGRLDSPVQSCVEGQSLTAEDQLLILMQAALYLSLTRGMQAPEVRICYERAEPLCHSLNRPLLLYVALIGQWRYSLATDKLPATMEIAKRVYSLAQEQNDSALLIKAIWRWQLRFTFWAISSQRNKTRYEVSRSGALDASSFRSKR